MKDYKSKEFFARQRQTAKDTERDEMEQHCSHRAMEWGQRPGYPDTPLAPIGHRGAYERGNEINGI